MDTGNGTGSITLMPGFSDAGTVSVTFTATNAGTSPLTASQDITVTVTDVNRPPGLTNPGDQSRAEGEAIVLQIVATDPDGVPLTFSATGLPSGLSINAATGQITGTIASGAAAGSPYSSVVTVTHGTTAVSTAFVWMVQPVPPTCPPNTVCIDSPPTPVADTFIVSVTFNAGTTPVVSYLFELSFDYNVVEVLDIDSQPPFDAVFTNPLAFSTGKVRFAANSTTSTPAVGLLTLAKIVFQVVGNSGDTSDLALAFSSVPGGQGVMVNNALSPIDGVTFVAGSVEVQ